MTLSPDNAFGQQKSPQCEYTGGVVTDPPRTMTQSILKDREAVSPRTQPTMTPHSHDQLCMSSSAKRSPGFRLLYEPDELGEDRQSEVAFVVEHPDRSYRIWTRHDQSERVPQDVFRRVYKPQSQTIQVPEQVEETVLEAWRDPHGSVTDQLNRLHPILQQGSTDMEEVVSR